MTCHNCRVICKKAGKRSDGLQRYRCSQCGKTFSDRKQFGMFGHKQIDEQRGLIALKLLVEGCSIRTAERMTGLHRDTIMKLLVIAGEKCENLLAEKIKDIPVQDVQVDELWGFCRVKEANRNMEDNDFHYTGDAWCFVGIERSTKLVLAFELGKRSEVCTVRFMRKIAPRRSPKTGH